MSPAPNNNNSPSSSNHLPLPRSRGERLRAPASQPAQDLCVHLFRRHVYGLLQVVSSASHQPTTWCPAIRRLRGTDGQGGRVVVVLERDFPLVTVYIHTAAG